MSSTKSLNFKRYAADVVAAAQASPFWNSPRDQTSRGALGRFADSLPNDEDEQARSEIYQKAMIVAIGTRDHAEGPPPNRFTKLEAVEASFRYAGWTEEERGGARPGIWLVSPDYPSRRSWS